MARIHGRILSTKRALLAGLKISAAYERAGGAMDDMMCPAELRLLAHSKHKLSSAANTFGKVQLTPPPVFELLVVCTANLQQRATGLGCGICVMRR